MFRDRKVHKVQVLILFIYFVLDQSRLWILKYSLLLVFSFKNLIFILTLIDLFSLVMSS